MNLTPLFYWCRDRVYPSPEGVNPETSRVRTDFLLAESLAGETLDSAYSWLKEQLKTEDDRFKIVEGKLQSVLPLSSVVITLLLALVAFLTNGKAGLYTKPSIVLVISSFAYVAIQFLWAFFRAINGLSRRSYGRADIDDIIPQPNDTKDIYVRRSFSLLAKNYQQNTESNNAKFTQLACAQEAIKNGVVGLVIVIILLLIISIFGNIG